MSGETQQGKVTGGLRHWLGFLGSGGFAFVVDGGVLKLLTLGFAAPVLPSRLISISIAMVAGWLAHRTFTFAITTPPTWAEFGRYIGIGWVVSALNYLLFAAIIFVWPNLEILIALFIAGLIAMVASYLGMRFGAFRGDESKR